MLSDLNLGQSGGDLVYVTSFMLEVGSRFSRLALISVCYLLA